MVRPVIWQHYQICPRNRHIEISINYPEFQFVAAAVCELARPIRHSPLNWLLHGGMCHMWCRLARLSISFIEDIEFDRFRFVGCSVCCNRIAKKLNHLNESSKLPAANNVCVTLESMPKLNRALCYGGCVNCVSETVQIGGNWILQTTTKNSFKRGRAIA